MTLHVPWIAAWYLLASVASFLVYGLDKQRARRSKWRIKESTLHWLDAAGGFPGGLVAQRYFRHKWRKRQFMIVYWLTVAGHAAGWILWMVYRR